MNNNVLAPTIFELKGDEEKELTATEATQQLRSYIVACQCSIGQRPLNPNHRLPSSVRQYESILCHLNLSKIDISTRQISQEAWDVIAPFIKAVANVMALRARSNNRTRRLTANPVNITLKMGDRMFAGRQSNHLQLGVFQMARELFGCLPIQNLDLSNTAGGDRTLDVLLPWVQDQLTSGNLKSLKLLNYGLSDDNIERVCDVLRLIPSNLKEIDVSRNWLDATGAAHFGCLLGDVGHQLESVTCVGARPQQDGSTALCDGLLRAAAVTGTLPLRQLMFDDLTLTGDGSNGNISIRNLADVLSKCPNLQVLGLSGCDLGLNGLEQILTAVEASGAIVTELHLADNALEDVGVVHLINFRSLFSGLRLLDLDGNDIGQIGAQRLVDNPLPALKILSLEENTEIPLNLAEELKDVYGDKVRIDLEDLEGANEGNGDFSEDFENIMGMMSRCGLSQEY